MEKRRDAEPIDLDKTTATLEPENNNGGGLFVPGKDMIVFRPPERKSLLGLDVLAKEKRGGVDGGFKAPSVMASIDETENSEFSGLDVAGSNASNGLRSHANDRSKKRNRRVWSKDEEDALLNVLDDVVAKGYQTENGTFKPGTLGVIEKALATLCPRSDLKANPHIESKMKKWKKDYSIIFDMLNKSGFGWNDTKKCIEVDSNEVWEAYVQMNKDADGWRDKSFPIYERLANIYGLDRATGKDAETPVDMMSDPGNNDETDPQSIDIGDDEENSPMSVSHASYSQQSNRRKRSRPSDGLVSGLDNIAASVREMIAETKEEVHILADSIRRPKLTAEMQQFLRVELKRLGLSVGVRVKAMNIFLASPEKFEVFKGYDEDEEKLEFIYESIGP